LLQPPDEPPQFRQVQLAVAVGIKTREEHFRRRSDRPVPIGTRAALRATSTLTSSLGWTVRAAGLVAPARAALAPRCWTARASAGSLQSRPRTGGLVAVESTIVIFVERGHDACAAVFVATRPLTRVVVLRLHGRCQEQGQRHSQQVR
jgi:hypothetical protein